MESHTTLPEPTGSDTHLGHLPIPDSYIPPDIPSQHPSVTRASAGIGGAILRTVKGVKPFIWVTNGHDVPIAVVVSKEKPKRLLTGMDINAAIDGGGVGFSSQTYQMPATSKILQPNQEAAFPLWTRSNGYGVLSIYLGAGEGRTLFVENDRIAAGVRATFVNEPDLVVEDVDGKVVGA